MQNRTCRKNSERFGKWLLPCVLIFSSAWASASEVAQLEANSSDATVEAEFTQAVKRFKAGDYVSALEKFVALKRRTPSPNVELYIGYCFVQLGRLKEAYGAFERSLEQTNTLDQTKYQATRSAAQQQLLELNPSLSKLKVSLVNPPAGAIVKLDGVQLEAGQLDQALTLEPGVHVIEAEAPRARRLVKSVAIEKGGNKTIALMLANDSSQREPSRPRDTPTRSKLTENLAWTTAGAGLVGWGLFTIAGLNSRSIYTNLKQDCPDGCADAAHKEQADKGRSWQAAANVGLAIGVLGTISAATLFGIDAARGNPVATKAEVNIGPHGAQISYEGRF